MRHAHVSLHTSATDADCTQTISARFEASARAHAGRIALEDRARRWTYEALNQRVHQVAHAIRTAAPQGPAPVALLAGHVPEMVIGFLAVLKAGRTVAALHPGMPAATLERVVDDLAPALVLTSGAQPVSHRLSAGRCERLDLETLDPAAPGDEVGDGTTAPDDPAVVLYTSGSTGRPKGVVWSHRRLLHRVALAATAEATSPDDRQSLLTHVSLANAQGDVLGALLSGAALCLFDVATLGLSTFADWLDADRITLLRTPAPVLRRFLATLEPSRQFRGVRSVSVGGELTVPDVERWASHFPRPSRLFLRFSTTETGIITLARVDHDTPLDVAAPLAGLQVPDRELSLLTSDGQPAAAGVDGELVVSSAFMAEGYWGDADGTARAFVADPLRPGRRSYRTGDRGRLLADGRFEFLGRRDAQVKIRGHRVELHEVESVLREHPAVADAGVVALRQGESSTLVAFVTARDLALVDAARLRVDLLENLPPWKVPSHVAVVPALPLTSSGKLDRQWLEAEARRLDDAHAVEAVAREADQDDALEATIAAEWTSVLRRGRPGRHEAFFSLGGDSLQATVLHLQIERAFGVRVPLEGLFRTPTVAGMAPVVRAALQGAVPPSRLSPVLVPFRTTGRLTPLFLVHGRMGRAAVRPQFLELLGDEQPVYGFQATGLDALGLQSCSIPDMARAYVAAVRQVQPVGPYFLGAACSGCVVVTEMANQLRAEGQTVAPLLLLDPPLVPLGDRSPWSRWGQRVRILVRRRFPSSPLNAMANRLRMRQRAGIAAPTGQAMFAQTVRAAMDFALAGLAHRHWNYDGPVLLLRSRYRLERDGTAGGFGTFTRHLTGDVRAFEAGRLHREVVGAESELAVRRIRECVQLARDALSSLQASGQSAERAEPQGATTVGMQSAR